MLDASLAKRVGILDSWNAGVLHHTVQRLVRARQYWINWSSGAGSLVVSVEREHSPLAPIRVG